MNEENISSERVEGEDYTALPTVNSLVSGGTKGAFLTSLAMGYLTYKGLMTPGAGAYIAGDIAGMAIGAFFQFFKEVSLPGSLYFLKEKFSSGISLENGFEEEVLQVGTSYNDREKIDKYKKILKKTRGDLEISSLREKLESHYRYFTFPQWEAEKGDSFRESLGLNVPFEEWEDVYLALLELETNEEI